MAKKKPPVPTAVSEYMASIGAKGGRAGGAKRREMPKKRRIELARKAADAMWAKRRAEAERVLKHLSRSANKTQS